MEDSYEKNKRYELEQLTIKQLFELWEGKRTEQVIGKEKKKKFKKVGLKYE